MNYDQNSINQWHFRHDALEAFNSFSAARNLFFWITITGMLIIQGVFWAVDRGAIDKTAEIPQQDSININNNLPGGTINTNSHSKNFILCTSNFGYSFCEEKVESEAESPAEEAPMISPEKAEPSDKTSIDNGITLTKILNKTTQIAKILVIFSMIMYCVCLFLCIQLTLTGSLGGMSLSTNAFFFSLVAALFILPWQQSVMEGIPAALFTFEDIKTAYSSKTEATTLSYYAKFQVMWSIAFILLLISQWRSCQAVKQIATRAKEWKSVNPLAQHSEVQHIMQPSPSQPGAIPLAAQTGAPIAPQPNHQPPQNPNDTGYDNSPIPIE